MRRPKPDSKASSSESSSGDGGLQLVRRSPIRERSRFLLFAGCFQWFSQSAARGDDDPGGTSRRTDGNSLGSGRELLGLDESQR